MITIAEFLKHKEIDKPRPKTKTRPKPPKTYLSQEDQKNIIIAAAFVAEWQQIIRTWQEIGRPTEQVKYAKSALTFVFKSMDCIMENLPDSEKMKVIRRAGHAKVSIEG